MDPLEYLDDDCVRILLSFLSSVELVRGELVSQSWKKRLQWWMVDSGIRLHFRYAWEAPNREGPAHGQFKRLACQEQALRLGEPTSVRRFPNAHHFAVAGDRAVWAVAKGDSIHWRLLAPARPDGKVGETNELDLRRVGPPDHRIALSDVDLNADGYLLLRILVGPNIYFYWDRDSFMRCRDVVYSLIDGKVAWAMDHATATPRLTPLLIGRQRVYFGRRTPEHGYDLVAYELHTQDLLYQVPLIAHIADHDHGCLGRRRKRRDILELIQHGGEELIIQFNSDRLVSFGFGSQRHFAIINGRNGQIIQQIGWDGFQGRPTVALSSSTTLALVDSVHRLYSKPSVDVVMIQTFSRQSDGSFVRTGVQMVTAAAGTALTGSVVIHPFTFQAFTVRTGEAPEALTLSPDGGMDHGRTMNATVQQASPGVTVDKYHGVTAAPRLTLPPRRTNGGRGGRQKFPVRAEWNHGFLVLVDERRVIFDHTKSKDDAVYLFDFTPQW